MLKAAKATVTGGCSPQVAVGSLRAGPAAGAAKARRPQLCPLTSGHSGQAQGAVSSPACRLLAQRPEASHLTVPWFPPLNSGPAR